ncbi:MAG TPA: PEP-CTERM sorting domain-containing protein [Lacunisphaera sp.]|nr:PEP-CTERM sorting domain-containing protein [Lacunisphaera sp.]
MKKLIFGVVAGAALNLTAFGQLVLDDFGTSHTGAVNAATTWNTALTFSGASGTMTVGSPAMNDSGYVSNFAITDISAWSYVAVTASVDAGNAATSLKIGFVDDNGNSEAFTIPTSAFTSTLSTQYVQLAWTTVDPTLLVQWNIGGGLPTPGTLAFRMTFDNLSLSTTGAPIPEPSTYAAMLGAAALGLVALRRRQVAVKA